MKKIFIIKIILFIVLFNVNIFCENSLQQEYIKLSNEYEKLKIEYWKTKENNLKKRAMTDDNLKMLDNEIKNLYLKKNNITEEIYLKKEYLNNIQQKKDSVQDDMNNFKKIISDKIILEQTKIKNKYPDITEQLILKLNSIKNKMKNNSPLKQIIKDVTDYKKYLIQTGEEIKLYKRKIYDSTKNISVDAVGLRIGYINNIYSSDKSTGFLIRSESLKGIYYKWITKIPDKLKIKITKIINKTINSDKSQIINIPTDINQSGEKLEQLTADNSKSFFSSLIDYFKKGGITMYPLLLTAIFALYLIIERLVFFKKNYKKTNEIMKNILELLNKNQSDKAIEFCKNHGNPITKIVLPIIEKNHNTNRETVEKIISEVLAGEIPLLNKKLSTLSILAAIAPLLGLLGTVSGMITLFNVITVYGTSNPKILAGGISIALITTQTGLSIAIVIMFIHHYLVRKKNNILNLIEENTIKLLNKYYPN